MLRSAVLLFDRRTGDDRASKRRNGGRHSPAAGFNQFDFVNFGQPVLMVNNRNFGRIPAAGDSRILQFAVRYRF